MAEDVPGAIDTPNEYIGFTMILLVVGGLFGGIYVFNSPYLSDRIYSLTHDKPEFSGNQVVFAESYDGVDTRSSLNKIYSDTDTEYGWCMRVQGDAVESLDTFTGLNETTPSRIRFSCSQGKHNAIMHTHPGRYGATALSEQDEETLMEVSWVDVSCVIGGEVEDRASNPRGLKCFSVKDDEIQRLDVSLN